MNLTHNGKIGRLPKSIQEQINRRLDAGEKGPALVAWLNTLPEVSKVMAAEFQGRPVRQQNLSEWRKLGYQKWLARQEAAATAAEAAKSPIPLAAQLSTWATARYLLTMTQLMDQNSSHQRDFKLLRKFCHDIVALRRNEHTQARLKLDQDRLQFHRQTATPATVPLRQTQVTKPEATGPVGPTTPVSTPQNRDTTSQPSRFQSEISNLGFPQAPMIGPIGPFGPLSHPAKTPKKLYIVNRKSKRNPWLISPTPLLAWPRSRVPEISSV